MDRARLQSDHGERWYTIYDHRNIHCMHASYNVVLLCCFLDTIRFFRVYDLMDIFRLNGYKRRLSTLFKWPRELAFFHSAAVIIL